MTRAVILRSHPFGPIAADSSAAGTVPEALGNNYLGVVHRNTNTSSAWVTLDFGVALPVDTVAFLSANCQGAQTLRIRCAATAAAVTSAPVYDGTFDFRAGTIQPANGRSNAYVEIPLQTQRYWRFDIGALGGTAFEAGRLLAGQRIVPGNNFNYGAIRGVRDTGGADVYPGGGVLIRRGRVLRRLQMQWDFLRADLCERELLPLIETIGAQQPIMIVTDPRPSPDRQGRMYFGWLQTEQDVAIRAYDTWTWRAELVSVL